MNKPFRPMLAGTVEDYSKVVFPVYGSPKLDGVRCLGMNGLPMSRSMKPIPNRFIQNFFEERRMIFAPSMGELRNISILDGFDGELIIGDPTQNNTYNTTVSGVMREESEPDFTYYVFDQWDIDGKFSERMKNLQKRISIGNMSYNGFSDRVKFVPQEFLTNLADLEKYEDACLRKGYEGVMLRGIESPYKQGRSTFRGGHLLKVKRFQDAEATIIGFWPLLRNNNEAKTNEIGRTHRSSHQANKIPMETLGALLVRFVYDNAPIQFSIGAGFDEGTRKRLWENRYDLLGKMVKFKYFNHGVKTAPRHPVYIGFRDALDM